MNAADRAVPGSPLQKLLARVLDRAVSGGAFTELGTPRSGTATGHAPLPGFNDPSHPFFGRLTRHRTLA